MAKHLMIFTQAASETWTSCVLGIVADSLEEAQEICLRDRAEVPEVIVSKDFDVGCPVLYASVESQLENRSSVDYGIGRYGNHQTKVDLILRDTFVLHSDREPGIVTLMGHSG